MNIFTVRFYINPYKYIFLFPSAQEKQRFFSNQNAMQSFTVISKRFKNALLQTHNLCFHSNDRKVKLFKMKKYICIHYQITYAFLKIFLPSNCYILGLAKLPFQYNFTKSIWKPSTINQNLPAVCRRQTDNEAFKTNQIKATATTPPLLCCYVTAVCFSFLKYSFK